MNHTKIASEDTFIVLFKKKTYNTKTRKDVVLSKNLIILKIDI